MFLINYTIFIFLTQLKSLANTQSALDDIDNLKNVTDEMLALKNIGEKYSRETLKEALAQSELNDIQIKNILEANKMQGALLETTTNQLANAASANKMAKAQKAASSSTLELGKAFKGLGIKLGNMIKAHPILAVTTAVIALGTVIGLISDRINNAEKYAKNALDKSAEKVNTVKSEIESLNSELQTTKDRINELKAKENLSLQCYDKLPKQYFLSKYETIFLNSLFKRHPASYCKTDCTKGQAHGCFQLRQVDFLNIPAGF